MERIRTTDGIKEAKETAEYVLSKWREKEGKDPQKRDSWKYFEYTQDGKAYANFIEDEETGYLVVYLVCGKDESGEDYTIMYVLNAYENDPNNYTYPLRNIRKELLFFALCCGAIFYKPEKAISLDEALTPEGADEIYHYPIADEEDEWERFIFDTWKPGIADYAAEDYFKETDEEDKKSPSGKRVKMLCRPLPSILQELTGVDIRNEKDYVKALEKRLERKLSAAERQQAEALYVTLNGQLLLAYAVYEFARTESYAHLQEILSSYEKFGLPEDWYSWTYSRPEKEEGETTEYESAEQEVISRYLATKIRKKLKEVGGLKDIAEVTGIPYPELLKAEKEEFWAY